MEHLEGKLAVVSGASAGIGACIVKSLLAAGMTVVGLARRVQLLDEQLRNTLPEAQQSRLHAIQCDVSDDEQVSAAFAHIAQEHGVVRVLINNAGCLRPGQLCRMDAGPVQQVLQTNIVGVVNCTRHAFAAMQAAEGVGHVVLINSILGHQVAAIPGHLPALNIYPATKFALTAINEIYRQEFKELGTRIKVTSISPGLVDTEFISAQQKSICRGAILQPEDVAQAVMYVLATPPHVQVHELILKPVGEIV